MNAQSQQYQNQKSRELAQVNLRNNEVDTMEDLFGEAIYTYTRQQAIEDGVLIDLGQTAREYYKFQVCVTASIWAEIMAAAVQDGQDLRGIVRDILFMSQRYITKRISQSEHYFKVVIAGTTHDYKIMVHGGDFGEAVITILQLNED